MPPLFVGMATDASRTGEAVAKLPCDDEIESPSGTAATPL